MGVSKDIYQERHEKNGILELQFFRERFASDILEVSEMEWLKELSFDDPRGVIAGQRAKGVFSYRTYPILRDQSPPVDLTPLSKLKSLRRLVLGFAPIDDIMPLVELPQLEDLSLPFALLDDFKPLGAMHRLKSLSLENTAISDLRPLEKLGSLTSLSLASCLNVKFIDYLSNLESLEYLYLQRTNVKQLGPLFGLAKLKHVNLDDTKVEDLATLRGHIERGLTVGTGHENIQVNGCPLNNPPQEVVKQGRKAVIKYFRYGKTSWWLPPW